ncbi:hypothetical protein SPONL_1913 [uncultured Candidatus Thioglobus sp.]|nr:hypothetical protein SPONL_1913 [uncultured Candidatus Thioglobus sp.]
MNIEQIKQEIGIFKVLLSIFSITQISLIAWIFNNLNQKSDFNFKMFLALVSFVIISYFVISFFNVIIKLIKQIGVVYE